MIYPLVDPIISPDILAGNIIPSWLKPSLLSLHDGSKQLAVHKTLTQNGTNMSFEDDLTGWTVGGEGTAEASTSEYKHGAKSLRLVMSGNAANAREDLAFSNGHIIMVSMWIKLISGSVSGGVVAIVYDGDGTSNPINIIPSTLDGTWRKTVILKTVAANGIRIYLGRATNQTVEYHIDAIQVINLTTDIAASLEPTATEMDDILTQDGTAYWDGAKSVHCNPANKYFWHDYSGNGRYLKLNNMAYSGTSGWQTNPPAMGYDGVNDCAIGNIATIAQHTDVSIGGWFAASSSKYVVSLFTGTTYAITIYISGNKYNCYVNDSSSGTVNSAFGSASNSNIHFVVGVYSQASKKCKVYVDAVPGAESAALINGIRTSSSIMIAKDPASAAYALMKNSYTFAVSRALTAGEVRQLFQGSRRRYGV